MFFVDLLFALLIGLLLSVLFTLIFDARGPWDIFWVFLLLVVLGSWVGGLWLVPFGPVLFDVAWIPFLLAGLFFALILAAATPPPPFSTRTDVTPPAGSGTVLAFSLFFWILLLGLVAAIILAYV